MIGPLTSTQLKTKKRTVWRRTEATISFCLREEMEVSLRWGHALPLSTTEERRSWSMQPMLRDGNFLSTCGRSGYELYTPNYSVTTIFVAVSLFLFTLAVLGLFKRTRLPKLGKFAVGIYIVHPVVWHGFLALREALATIAGINLANLLTWHFLLTPLIYIISFAIFYQISNTQSIPVDSRAKVNFGQFVEYTRRND